MNKEDICEPVEISKENWSKVLSTVIKSSIECADRIGDNLKKQCIDYFEQLEKNRDELKKWLEEEKNKHYDRKWLSDDELCYRLEDNSAKTLIEVQTKIEEIERGKE